MERLSWRYHPEFQIRILIDGVSAGSAVMVRAVDSPSFRNYGLLARANDGGMVCFVKQTESGGVWQPAVPLNTPTLFAFWVNFEGVLPFFSQPRPFFGPAIFYANNLSLAGAIDANLVGNSVSLTAGADAGATEIGAAMTSVFSAEVPAGDYTQISAGKIRLGAPVSFSINQAIAAEQTRVGLDLSLLDRGAYVVHLDGAVPHEERGVSDQRLVLSQARGVIEIYRDAWLSPVQPREYTVNFLSV